MSEVKARVTCKRGIGLWRGGRFWPNGHTEIILDEESIEALLREPLLTVAIQDGEKWRTATKEPAPTARPAQGEPALSSEVKDLEDTIRRLRDQLRGEREVHCKELAEMRKKMNDASAEYKAARSALQGEIEALKANPPAPVAQPAPGGSTPDSPAKKR